MNFVLQMLSVLVGGGLVCCLMIARIFWSAHKRAKLMGSAVESRRIISLNPLGSGRDFAIFFAVILAFSCAILGLTVWGVVEPDDSRVMFFGALWGSTCMMLIVLPVRCVFKPQVHGRLVGRLRELGYSLSHVGAEGEVYDYNSPRWMKWDSNRIIVSFGEDCLQVICPLCAMGRIDPGPNDVRKALQPN